MTAIDKDIIYKYDLLKFLRKLRKEARYIYRVLTGAPLDYVWITKSEGGVLEGEETLSVNDFIAQYSRFKAKKDEFCLCFKSYYTRSELHILDPNWRSSDTPITGEETFSADYKEELALSVISEEFPHLIAYICREAILVNRPFLLMEESVKKQYGFARPDIDKLRNVVIHYNQAIVEELQEEYNRLGAIDWVKDVRDTGIVNKP